MALRTIDRSGQVFTYADLEDVPSDENRYELSYGTLVVTPAPNTRHQAVMVTVARSSTSASRRLSVFSPKRSCSSNPTSSNAQTSR